MKFFLIGILIIIIAVFAIACRSSTPNQQSIQDGGNLIRNNKSRFRLETYNGIVENVGWDDILFSIDELSSRDYGFVVGGKGQHYRYLILSDGRPFDEIPSGDFAYLQTACDISGERKGVYDVETRQIDLELSGGFRHYRFETADKNEVVEIFKNWFNGQPLDLSKWKDVTSEY